MLILISADADIGLIADCMLISAYPSLSVRSSPTPSECVLHDSRANMRQMPCHVQVETEEAFKEMLEEILGPSAEPLIDGNPPALIDDAPPCYTPAHRRPLGPLPPLIHPPPPPACTDMCNDHTPPPAYRRPLPPLAPPEDRRLEEEQTLASSASLQEVLVARCAAPQHKNRVVWAL